VNKRTEILANLEKVLDQKTPTETVFRHCISASIFMELSRSNFICMYRTIMDESNQIQEEIKRHGVPKQDYSILWSLDKATHVYVPNSSLAIMSFKQSNVMDTLLMLTERLDSLPFEAFDELKMVVKLLYTRNGVFFCQETPNLLDRETMRDGNRINRDYAIFCSIYFHALFRRMYYYELLERIEIHHGDGEMVREWVTDDVCKALGAEGFEDCFQRSCEEAYAFPGDLEWFAYRYPNLPKQTGPILGCFRPEYAKRYYTDYRLSKEAVLSAVQQPTHAGHCARLFVINAVDQYMKIHYSVPWKDGLVIPNNGMEGAQTKLFRNDAPYLVQVLSRYSVYHDRKIYSSNCLYETIAMWMRLLKLHYASQIYERTDLKDLLDRLGI